MAIIAAAVYLAYLPSLSGGFIWDDHDLITNNRLVTGADGPHKIWCTTEPIDYWPLTNTAFWLEWRLWGLNSAGYHATNLILHIVETLLVWVILRRLAIPGAFLAAMIFALHPVNVESVAWIAQCKNLMEMLFFLLSILWYVDYLKRDRLRLAAKQIPHPSYLIPNPSYLYCLSLAAFVLAMLSKGSAAALPIVLLGIVWWLVPQRAATPGDAGEKGVAAYVWRYVCPVVPFFVIAGALTAVNMWFQTFGMKEAIRPAGVAERLLGAGGVVWFYLYKAIWPVHLSFVYTNWDIQPADILWWLPLLCALGVTGVLWWCRKGWSRGLLFAWGLFCVALLPVMGFSDVYFMRYALVADHYQHMAIIAAAALAAATWEAWHRLASGWVRGAASASAVAILGALAVLTWQQNGQYRDEITLWNETLRKSPVCWMAHINRGKFFTDTGRLQDAMDDFRQAAQIKEDCIEAYNDMGNVCVQSGRPEEALEYYRKALSWRPDYVKALNNMGNALNEAGRFDESVEYCQRALKLDPNFQEAWFNLANAYLDTGRPGEAIGYYRRALAIQPEYPQAHNNLGNALNQLGRREEAVAHFQTALSLKPDFAEAHLNMGNAWMNLDRLAESIEQYEQALVLKPGLAQAHNNLGGALFKAGRRKEAIEHLRESIRLRPQFTDAYYNLALAYTEMRQWTEAEMVAKQALELARSQGQTAFVRQIEGLLGSCAAALKEQRENSDP